MSVQEQQLIAQLIEQQREAVREIVEAQRDLRAVLGESESIRQQELDALKAQLENAKQVYEFLQGTGQEVREAAAKRAEELEKRIENQKTLAGLSAQEIIDINNQIKFQKALANATDEQLEVEKEKNKELIKANVTLGKTIVFAEETVRKFKNLFGVTDSWRRGTLGGFTDLISRGNSFNNIVKEISKSFFSISTFDDILVSSFMKVAESTVAVAVSTFNTVAAFEKATAAGGRFSEEIEQLNISNRRFGVSISDSASAVQSFVFELDGFGFMAQDTRRQLEQLSVVSEKLGIDNQTTAKNIQFLTKALGMTAPQAVMVSQELVGLADALRKPPAVIMADFQKASNMLAFYGDDMIGTFKRLSAASVTLGTDISNTLSFVDQFETFRGAAQASARLSGLLGTIINPMDMMGADPTERIRNVIRAVEETGMSAQMLNNRFAVRAFAEAAGIKDMNMAMQLLRGGLAEFDAQQARSRADAMEQSAMLEQTKNALDTVTMLRSILEQFAIAVQPAVAALKVVFDGVSALNQALGNALVPAIIGAMLAFRGLAMLRRVRNAEEQLGNLTIQQRIGLLSRELQLQNQLNASRAAGGAAGAAGQALLLGKAAMIAATGLAIAGLAAAIFLLASAFEKLVSVSQNASMGDLIGGFVMLATITAGVAGLTKVLLVFAPAAGATALSLLGVGAAVLMITGGMAILALAFAQLGENAAQNSEAMLAFGGSMLMLAGATALMSLAGVGALVGFTALAVGIGLVALALSAIGTEDLTALGNMFEGLGKIAEAGGVKLGSVSAEVTKLAALASEMEGKEINTFVNLANATEKFGFAAEKITEPAMDRVRTVAAAPMQAAAVVAAATDATVASAPQAASQQIVHKFYLSIGEEEFIPLLQRYVPKAIG